MGFVPSVARRGFPLQCKLPTLNAPTALILFLSIKEVPKVCAAIQKDLNRLEKWVDRAHHMKSKGRYKILQLGRNNPRYQCTLGPPAGKPPCRKGSGGHGGHLAE